ncbi:MAG: Type 1 glutamine amidotransferase-like domain-containing protein [Planctomycetes bacterium]|nr:Type 1 glutamine amidotransferase-like domain-containing protein [Planctomycetota bacterium]
MVRSNVVLLGPQRLQPTLKDAVDSLGVRGRIASVTAGWEEREREDQELAAHLHNRTYNLGLFERTEDVYRCDPELATAMRARHDRLRKLQELYRVRLSHLMEAARELLRRESLPGYAGLIEPEVRGAIDAVRRLDDEHVQRVREVHVEFAQRWKPQEREHVARHRREIKDVLDSSSALCIAGGHVAILLNRLRLFGVLDLLREQPILAWSAGAMVVTERVVVFHDRPPQGAGDAEVLEVGLSAVQGVVALPHADKRLHLDDRTRVALFARRFEPAVCAALWPCTRMDWRDGRWSGQSGTRKLTTSGELLEVGA